MLTLRRMHPINLKICRLQRCSQLLECVRAYSQCTCMFEFLCLESGHCDSKKKKLVLFIRCWCQTSFQQTIHFDLIASNLCQKTSTLRPTHALIWNYFFQLLFICLVQQQEKCCENIFRAVSCVTNVLIVSGRCSDVQGGRTRAAAQESSMGCHKTQQSKTAYSRSR